MIGQAAVDTIQKLLAAGNMPVNDIARAAGVGRMVVYEIKVGVNRRRERRDAGADEQQPEKTDTKFRCPGCGGKITGLSYCLKCSLEMA